VTPTPINIGPGDGAYITLPDGTTLDINLPIPIIVSGAPEPAYDLVYYEHPFDAIDIHMDWIIIQISETGASGTWYTVFNWGDYVADNNTNVAGFTPEDDNLPIPMASLYGIPPAPKTGIAIDVDSLGIPAGTYGWLRLFVPVGGAGDGADVDAIEVLP
jgi:hypothetical protein